MMETTTKENMNSAESFQRMIQWSYESSTLLLFDALSKHIAYGERLMVTTLYSMQFSFISVRKRQFLCLNKVIHSEKKQLGRIHRKGVIIRKSVRVDSTVQ